MRQEGACVDAVLRICAVPDGWSGTQFDKPTEDYFKRVQVFDRITARPGSVLLRDKKNPDIAIFGNVEQIKNADFSWKPTIIEAYTKNFGDKFKLISQSGPTKTGGVDMYTFEYVVEKEFQDKALESIRSRWARAYHKCLDVLTQQTAADLKVYEGQGGAAQAAHRRARAHLVPRGHQRGR